jgi:hypothetical protein
MTWKPIKTGSLSFCQSPWQSLAQVLAAWLSHQLRRFQVEYQPKKRPSLRPEGSNRVSCETQVSVPTDPDGSPSSGPRITLQPVTVSILEDLHKMREKTMENTVQGEDKTLAEGKWLDEHSNSSDRILRIIGLPAWDLNQVLYNMKSDLLIYRLILFFFFLLCDFIILCQKSLKVPVCFSCSSWNLHNRDKQSRQHLDSLGLRESLRGAGSVDLQSCHHPLPPNTFGPLATLVSVERQQSSWRLI